MHRAPRDARVVDWKSPVRENPPFSALIPDLAPRPYLTA